MIENEVEESSSHSLFFAVVFMTALILITVVGYFLFLPDQAPKQISLAVVPFEVTPNTPPYIQHALPREIREWLSRSRDVLVVDYEAAEAVIGSEKPFRGFIRELGATHFVDGVVESVAQDEEVLTIRLVDGTQPAWKTKRQIQFALSSTAPMEIVRETVQTVRDGLYDTSAGPLALPDELSTAFTLYLEAQDQFERGNLDAATLKARASQSQYTNAYAAHLLAVLMPEREDEFLQTATTAIPQSVPALVASSKKEYAVARDLVAYLDELIPLVREYPNSEAVYELADAYTSIGLYREAEQLLFRWARMRPRSSDAALALSIARYRLGEINLSRDALKVAEARDADLPSAMKSLRLGWLKSYFERTDELNVMDGSASAIIGRTSSDCDAQFNEAFRSSMWEDAYAILDCVEVIFSVPPAWVDPDDETWLRFTTDAKYQAWVERMGLNDPRVLSYPVADVEQRLKSRQN